MKLLEDRIRRDGKVLAGDVLKVGSFLNQQMDVALYAEMAKEWKRLFDGKGVNKILTVEASGIGLACATAAAFGCPALFAKKSASSNIGADCYSAKVVSYTHNRVYDILVSREYLTASDRVLLIDDFLANGAALSGLIDLAQMAGAEVIGAGIAVEKAYQPGGDLIRGRGVRVESLARIQSMSEDGGIVFC